MSLGGFEIIDSQLVRLRLRLSLRKADRALTFFPLTALLEELNTLETLKN